MIIVAKSPFRYNKNQKIPARKLAGTGAGNVTRTRDLLITNQLLYRLSYSSALCCIWLPLHLVAAEQKYYIANLSVCQLEKEKRKDYI